MGAGLKVLGPIQWLLRGLAVVSVIGGIVVLLRDHLLGTVTRWRGESGPASEVIRRFWPPRPSTASTEVAVRPEYWDAPPKGWVLEGGVVPDGFAEYSSPELDEGTVGHFGTLEFWDPMGAARVVDVVALVAVAALTAWLWWTLSRVVGSARSGDPFVAANARRLTLIGALVLVGPYLVVAVEQAIVQWKLATSTASGKADVVFRWEDLSLWPLGFGLAVLALAAVWRRGVAMREDLEGLV